MQLKHKYGNKATKYSCLGGNISAGEWKAV